MKTFNLIAKIAFIGAALSGCATLFTGTSDRITFNSNPSGAVVYIDGEEQCRTPCKSLKVKRSMSPTEVEFKLDGYSTKVITLSREFNMMTALNLINAVGWAIDLVTGSVFVYDKTTYNVNLAGKGSSSLELRPSKIYIDTKNNVVELYVVENDPASLGG